MSKEMKPVKPNVESDRIFSGLFWVYLENIAGQLVSFVVTVLLARLLEPSYYGTIALVSVFIGIANVFVNSSFSFALVQKKDADEKDYSTLFWFNLVLSLFLYGLLFLTAPWIGSFYNNYELVLIVRVLALRIPATAYNSVQLAYVSSRLAFKKSFISNSGGALFSGFFGVLLAYLGYGIWALVAQSLLNVIFNTFLLQLVIKWKPLKYFSLVRLKPLASFGWKLLATGLMFTGYNELRSLVIGKYYSPADLGYYDRGFSFPRLIASNIDATINRVLFPALSQKQDNSKRLLEMTRRSAKTSAYIMTPVLFGLAIVAEPLVLLLLGKKWLPCVPYLQIFSLVWWLQPTQSCSVQAIKALGKSDVYLRIEIISKICGLVLLVGAIWLVNSVQAIAFSMLIGQALALFIYGIHVAKYIGYRMTDQLRDLLIPAAMGMAFCILLYYIPYYVHNLILCLLIQMLVGGIVYLCLSSLFEVETFTYLLNLVKKRIPNK